MSFPVQIIPDLVKGLFDTVHPRKGSGIPESLLLVVLAGLVFGGAYLNIVPGGTVERVIDVLLGALLGNGYQRKNGERNKSLLVRPPSVIGKR